MLDPENPSEKKAGTIRPIPCDSCGGESFKSLFYKESSRDESFQIVSCKTCGLVQVNPQPDANAVKPYYGEIYFKKRTDRGYNDYFSSALKRQINLVYEMNLRDLDFFEYEKSMLDRPELPSALDAGCAAGYFIEFLSNRGWKARGIEISDAAARFGIDKLGLDIIIDDFLSCDKLKRDSFDLISLWASLEHMHTPGAVLFRAFELLRPGGRMILSTCRYGLLARLKGKKWRYMNVPEHLYFFSLPGLIELAVKIGFRTVKTVTYGSGLTTKQNSGIFYKLVKKISDPLVKLLNQGDMMALHLIKH